MEKKMLFGEGTVQSGSADGNTKKETRFAVNIFQGRVEAAANNASFPDWDILPPTQFINPRMKKQ
ncbi:hypothetical protein [Flavihumibacter sp. CACIAM 22H1]|uniref:hypothetical protein n=1 Tax=Flavihumibacter sp. CACIAM 22H1 TaxID=1812911 RepID=UPI0007A91E42|nr:hypothetical protein [Flavihumibacter sp. CACIAM 22H1]KYP13368.1 MAG: hypothetical protein A1D16_20650 [Flavihumibacter sp. CACIAM 22H1]